MALPDKMQLTIGTEIVVADSLYVPTVESLGTRTDDIDIKDLAAGAARESVKINFGANLDLEYVLAACLEWETSPEIGAGETVSFYMGWSRSGTAGTSNPASLTGADAAYTGMTGGTLAGSLKLLDPIGKMTQDNVITSDTVQFSSSISTFTPRARYGILVVVNDAASAALHSDAVEMAISFTPLPLTLND